MVKAAVLRFSDIEVGQVYQFDKLISKQDVMDFARLTGDFNPLHVDEDFGRRSLFKKNVVHGMLAGSLFSTLVGMYCPGERSLYVSQTLKFRSPLYYDDTLAVRAIVTDKNESIKLVTLKTEILKDKKVIIDGEAKVKLLGDEDG